MVNREHVHQLVDRLADADVPALEKLLESLTEAPAVRAVRLALPDDKGAISQAESDTRPHVPLEELLAEFRIK